jgi:peptidoglycan hydrolase CwlO-like protein
MVMLLPNTCNYKIKYRNILHIGTPFVFISYTKKIVMNSKWIITAIVAMIISVSISAQVVSKDSITILKQQKEALKIGKKLNERKLELAKLENSVEKKTQDMQNTAQQAQSSAINNDEAANKLSTDAQDEKLANKASNSANTAKSDAKKARKAAKDLDKLQKKIESLKKKIAEDEAKLAALPAVPMPGN